MPRGDHDHPATVAPLTPTVPHAVRAGDRVAVVSPCGPVLDHGLLDRGIALLASWGLDVVEGVHVRHSRGHLAGSDDQRTSDLNGAIADPAVRAIWIARGGYGITRILDRIDWDALARDPTLIVGFSDVTALLAAARHRLGLVGVHGHFVGRLAVQPEPAVTQLRRLVFGEDTETVLHGAALAGTPLTAVSGPLVGGNLTVLAALAGTPHRIDARGCVLLLEEVGEAPYRVDRLLTQLRDSGALDGVAGAAVGTPVRCDPPATRPSGSFSDVVADRLGELGVPVVTDLPIGHMPEQRAVLHGGRVTLDASTGLLTSHDRLPSRRAHGRPRSGAGPHPRR
ncbi:MAG TPA: LD-carboxypeptidase [Euzebyales bacterium]